MSGGLPFDGDLDFRPAEEKAAETTAAEMKLAEKKDVPRAGSRQAPLTIRQLNEQVEATLADAIGSVWVTGEISRFTAHQSGHWYFTLRDGDAACVSCAMFRGNNQRLKFRPKDGMAVLALGTPGVYVPQGRMQLLVSAMEPFGVGAAALALEQLKARLAAEGLFDPARKKPLPLLPRTVGIATSLDGAALKDVLNVLRRRFAGVSVLIAPAAVQGATAPDEVCRALAALDRRGLDVLLLVRGGGAREDLAAFDDERVVRAVAACRTPIVTGVGHEIDTTLVDHAADVRAPTPSAAAELVVRERVQLVEKVDGLRRALAQALRTRLARTRNRLNAAENARGFRELPRRVERARLRASEAQRRIEAALLSHVRELRDRLRLAQNRLSPETRRARLAELRHRLAAALARSGTGARRLVQRDRARLGHAAAALHALSPLACLGRGYALATREGPSGPVVHDAAALAKGSTLYIRFARGAAEAAVTRVHGERNDE